MVSHESEYITFIKRKSPLIYFNLKELSTLN